MSNPTGDKPVIVHDFTTYPVRLISISGEHYVETSLDGCYESENLESLLALIEEHGTEGAREHVDWIHPDIPAFIVESCARYASE